MREWVTRWLFCRWRLSRGKGGSEGRKNLISTISSSLQDVSRSIAPAETLQSAQTCSREDEKRERGTQGERFATEFLYDTTAARGAVWRHSRDLVIQSEKEPR